MPKIDLSRIHAMADALKEKMDKKEDLDLVHASLAYELFDLLAEIDIILKDREITEEDTQMIMEKLGFIKKMIKNQKRSIQ